METKVVYNACYGGFGLSKVGAEMYEQLSGLKFNLSVHRQDPHLIKVIETLGKNANNRYSNLQIKVIPQEFKDCWALDEYDGLESIDLSPILLVA